MSMTSDAIRDREEAKRPKPVEVKKRGRKAVKGNEEGRAPVEEQAGEEVSAEHA